MARRQMARAGGHVLIIEDEMLVAMEVEDHLLHLGFETFDFALTPKEAIALACARRPDLVTADFRIQGGTGVDAVDGILAAIGEVPVIFVTGTGPQFPRPMPMSLSRSSSRRAHCVAHVMWLLAVRSARSAMSQRPD